jgi:hypothetical protein
MKITAVNPVSPNSIQSYIHLSKVKIYAICSKATGSPCMRTMGQINSYILKTWSKVSLGLKLLSLSLS